MLELTHQDHTVFISRNGRQLGSLVLSENPYHRRNCYVSLRLDSPDSAFSAELFAQLVRGVGRPLQVMVSSEDTQVTDFLIAGGFVCKRKCYEAEVSKQDFIDPAVRTRLYRARSGEPDFEICRRLMYDHYRKTHEAVNPWTAGFADFCEILPEEVFYEQMDGRIVHAAFVQDNEIAYVCGSEPERFRGFAASLLDALFSVHDILCFESDDCDWAAMTLRAMFANLDDESFDTYVYDYKDIGSVLAFDK